MKTPSPVVPGRQTLHRHYHSRRPGYAAVLDALQHVPARMFERPAINPTIKTRITSFDAYYEKLLRLLKKHSVRPEHCCICDVPGVRIIITGSLIGRYEKGGRLPLVQDGYRLLTGSVVDSLLLKLRSL